MCAYSANCVGKSIKMINLQCGHEHSGFLRFVKNCQRLGLEVFLFSRACRENLAKEMGLKVAINDNESKPKHNVLDGSSMKIFGHFRRI